MLVVRQKFPESPVVDIPDVLEQKLASVADRVRPGASIAVAVGSRGISNLGQIVTAVIGFLKRAGARPFIVPAMGSHGGGTPDGQAAVLAEYGITADRVGVPIRASTDSRILGVTSDGFEVFFSVEALAADGIVLINRVKPHTDFSGSLGSGLLKMMVVGLGKPAGAANYHGLALRLGYEKVIRASSRIILRSAPILFGVAILEDQRHQTARLEVVEVDDMEHREEQLFAEARAMMPNLPFDEIDLLIVDRIGKEISGAGMDPAVIGRSIHGYTLQEDVDRPYPRVKRLLVRDLTPESRGNAIGIGMADFTTTRLVKAIDWQATRLNALTARSIQCAKIPIHYDTDREVIERALATLTTRDVSQAKVVRISDTLSLEHLEVSEAFASELVGKASLEVVRDAGEMCFDDAGNLLPLEV
jgi:hypothetical protein